MTAGILTDIVVNNTFILYLTGGFTIVYFMALIIAHSNRRKRPSVIVLKTAKRPDDLGKYYDYCIEITTSTLPGSSLGKDVKVNMELNGTFQCCDVELQTNRFERTILQRGCRDIFLVQSNENLGDVKAVSFSFKKTRISMWRIKDITVMNWKTKQKWYFPVFRKIKVSPLKPVVLQARCKYYRNFILFYLSRLWETHQWLSPFHQPIQFGIHTSFSQAVLIGLTLSLLMAAVIIGYVFSQNTETVFNISMQMLGFTFVATILSAIVTWCTELTLLNIRMIDFDVEQNERSSSLLEKSLALLKYKSIHDIHSVESGYHTRLLSTKTTEQSLHNAFSSYHSFNFISWSNLQGDVYSEQNTNSFETQNQLEEIVVARTRIDSEPYLTKELTNSSSNEERLKTQVEKQFYQATESFINVNNQVDMPTSKSLSDSVIDVTMRQSVFSDAYSYISAQNSFEEQPLQNKKCHFQEHHLSDMPSSEKQSKLECVKSVVCNLGTMNTQPKKLIKRAHTTAKKFSEPRTCAQYLLEEINIALNEAKDEIVEKRFDGKKTADKINFWTQVLIQYLWKEIKNSYDHSSWSEYGKEAKTLPSQHSSIFHSSGDKIGNVSSKRSLYNPNHSIFQTVLHTLPHKKNESFYSIQSWDAEDNYHFIETDEHLKTPGSTPNRLHRSVHSSVNILDTSDNLNKSLFRQLIKDVPYRPDQASLYRHTPSVWSTSSLRSETKEALSQIMKPKQLWDEDPPDFQSVKSYLYFKSTEILKIVVSYITKELPPSYLPASSQDLSVKTNDVITEIDGLLAVEVVDVFDYSVDLLYNCGLGNKFCPSPHGDTFEDILIFTQIFVSAIISRAYDIHSYEVSLGQTTRSLVRTTIEDSLYELQFELEEVSILTELCDTAIDDAKIDLWDEFQNTNLMFCQYLLKQSILMAKLNDMTDLSNSLKTRLVKCIELLRSKWKTQCIHRKFPALYYLVRSHIADNLKLCNNIQVISFIENVPTALNGLENHCQYDINRELKQSIMTLLSESLLQEKEDGFTELIFMNAGILAEYIEVFLDQNLISFSEQIEDRVSKIFDDFCFDFMGSQVGTAVPVVPPKVTEEQNIEQKGDISLKEVQDLISVVKPLKRYTRFLHFVHKNENKPIEINGYIDKVRKQNDYFTTVNLQNILDSYCMNEDNIPRTFTSEFLYNLENDVTGESSKPLPNCFGKWMKIFLFLCTLGAILFTSLQGLNFNVTQVQEWFCLYSIALIFFVFFLEPVKVGLYSWAAFK